VSPNPSDPLADELLEQLQSELPAALFATVSKKLLALQYAELKIQVLEERLRLKRIEMYGPGSEKLSNEQLELLDLEPGVSTAEVQAESAREPLPARAAEKRVRQHPGRQALPGNLPRVERVIAGTAEQCVCGGCGQATTVIGYEESEQLDVEPAKYFVVVTKREKRACKNCEERGVLAAPLPPRIIEKSLVSDRVVIDTVVSKYANHCPLYRQSVILERDSGLELSRQTLDGWVLRVGELLVLSGGGLAARAAPRDVTCKPMKRRWMYSCTMGRAAIIWRICGNTGNRMGRWCSISAWGAGVKAPNVFWKSSMACCRAMAMQFTIPWAGRRWCTRFAGRTHEGNSWTL
jgi:transposase